MEKEKQINLKLKGIHCNGWLPRLEKSLKIKRLGTKSELS